MLIIDQRAFNTTTFLPSKLCRSSVVIQMRMHRENLDACLQMELCSRLWWSLLALIALWRIVVDCSLRDKISGIFCSKITQSDAHKCWSSSSSSSWASERATQENFAWQAKSRRLVVGYGAGYSRSFTWVHSSFSIMSITMISVIPVWYNFCDLLIFVWNLWGIEPHHDHLFMGKHISRV